MIAARGICRHFFRCITQWLSTCLVAVPLLVAGPISSAEEQIYRKKDESGRTTFSDRGTSDDELVVPREPTIIPDEAFEKEDQHFDYSRIRSQEDAPPPVYSFLRIEAPVDDEVIRDNGGNLHVSAILEPPLRTNHVMQVLLDDKVMASSRTGAFQLANVDRGVHQIAVQVVEPESGDVIATSGTVQITLLRFSRLHRRR